MMIGGICESPLTIRALHRLARRAERRPRCCCATSSISTPPTAPRSISSAAARRGAPRARTPRRRGRGRRGRRAAKPAEARPEGEGEDGDGEENNDLARGDGSGAEAPGARHPRRDRRHSTRSCSKRAGAAPRLPARRAEEFRQPTEKRYDKLKHEMVELMKSVQLNNARIEQLVDQHVRPQPPADDHGRQAAAPGRTAGVKRQDFLNHHSATSSTRPGRPQWPAARQGWTDLSASTAPR